jgi:hypothetical protein
MEENSLDTAGRRRLIHFGSVILGPFAQFTLSGQSEILRGVYRERTAEILRFAQNDRRRDQDESEELRMTSEGIKE